MRDPTEGRGNPTEGLPEEAFESWRQRRSTSAVTEGFADRVMARADTRVHSQPSPGQGFSATLRVALTAAASVAFLARLFSLAWVFLD